MIFNFHPSIFLKRKMRYTIIFIVGLWIALFPACNSTDLQLIHPYRGTIQASFTELARTRLEDIYDINMPLSGEIERITLDPGDTVQKNQIIAQLVLSPWKQAMQEAQAQVDQTHVLLEQQLTEFHRLEKLFQQKFISTADFDNARFKTEVLKALLRRHQATLKTAQYYLRQAIIRSPIHGTILNRFTQGKKWLAEGQPLFQIGNLKELEAIAEVLTHQAQRLRKEDPVILRSLDHRVQFEGKVKRVDPAGFTKRSSLGVEEQRVDVIIRFTDSEAFDRLGVEFQLQAQFFIGQLKTSALIVPRFSVLQDAEGRYYVFKVVDHRLKKQIVEIDIMTDREISIRNHLSIQDQIVAEPSADLFDGMKI